MALVASTRGITGTDAVRAALTGSKRDTSGYVLQLFLVLSLLFSLGILAVLLARLAGPTATVLGDRGLDFITSGPSSDPTKAGVWQAIYGSFWIAVFVVVLAFPIGIGAALWLEEYAKQNRLTRFITVTIRNLAGVPSVVFGLLGLAVFVGSLSGLTGGNTLVSAGLTMSILVLPIVVITATEAIRAVPKEMREAGYGVGATQWEVIRSHVLPYAAPGILTGTVLSLARALGEAAPLIVVGAVSFFTVSPDANVIDRLRGDFTALPDVIYNWSSRPQIEFRQDLAPAAITVMLLVVLTANAAAILLRNRYEQKNR
jgi:phosphate transport system permease protein